MAERRMFAKSIITSDAFLDLPLSSRCLYFSLAMYCDDDGFCNNPKSIMRQVGATQDDMNILIAKKFLLVFDNGVIVIKHWRIHNYIRSDRYHETNYKEEKATLSLDENGAYTRNVEKPMLETGIPVGIPAVDQRSTEDRDSIGKDRDNNKHKYGEFKNILLTDDELKKLQEKFPKDWSERIENCSIYVKSTGKSYKSHYATILNWARKEPKKEEPAIKPKRYREFKTEEYEKEGFVAESMPDEIRNKFNDLYGGEK